MGQNKYEELHEIEKATYILLISLTELLDYSKDLIDSNKNKEDRKRIFEIEEEAELVTKTRATCLLVITDLHRLMTEYMSLVGKYPAKTTMDKLCLVSVMTKINESAKHMHAIVGGFLDDHKDKKASWFAFYETKVGFAVEQLEQENINNNNISFTVSMMKLHMCTIELFIYFANNYIDPTYDDSITKRGLH